MASWGSSHDPSVRHSCKLWPSLSDQPGVGQASTLGRVGDYVYAQNGSEVGSSAHWVSQVLAYLVGAIIIPCPRPTLVDFGNEQSAQNQQPEVWYRTLHTGEQPTKANNATVGNSANKAKRKVQGPLRCWIKSNCGIVLARKRRGGSIEEITIADIGSCVSHQAKERWYLGMT